MNIQIQDITGFLIGAYNCNFPFEESMPVRPTMQPTYQKTDMRGLIWK